MAAVVRVKRRLDDQLQETLILNCKRRKLGSIGIDETEQSELSTVLTFAGTVKEDVNILTHIKKQNLVDIQDLKDHFKKHSVNFSEKLRAEHRESSKNNRYRIVNYFRSQNLEDGPSNDDKELNKSKSEVTILDIESDFNENDALAQNQNETKHQYVYDLYYTNSDDFGDAEIQDYVSVQPLNESLLFGSARDNGQNERDSDEDSEDSNAENNWRNDYPNESDVESVNENDMVEAMKKVDMSDDLLSSDEGEEGFVYGIDSESAGFEEGIDESDVDHYGEQYARFKAKHKKAIETSNLDHDYCGDLDENEYYY